ncbi:MAG TPA: SUMF1/EgtB/PvdO family nonheme iron enzyme [Ktedonobacterales bacterium]|nr:SUMF1/EgtB/PvdO family nonheme iron enzyme [Ktedonobacterales bacterium]
MSDPAAIPRIFVSHSHEDNDYCRAFIAALRGALGGDDAVWYDEHNLGWGNIRRTIERELEQRQHFVAILSPAAVESPWVNDEIDAALGLLREGMMYTISFVTALRCEVPRLLRGYKRIELASGEGCPPAEAAGRILRIVQPGFTRPGHQPPTAATPPAEAPAAPQAHVQLGAPAAVAPKQEPRVFDPLSSSGLTSHLEMRGILTPAVKRPERFPARLQEHGFTAWTAKDPQTGERVSLIFPPLCRVEGGPFRMGSDKRQDPPAHDIELPQHDVSLPAYAIGTFPVTVAEYACFVASGHPAPQKSFGTDWQTQLTQLDHPVTCITWHDATAYAVWLVRLTGQPWKLPTEAEWEKAARWDSVRCVSLLYPWGGRFDGARCNTQESGKGATTPVGAYSADDPTTDGSSPCGAQDMAGNVWEWCSSLYAPYPYDLRDGREGPTASGSRVRRGGSWGSYVSHIRAAYRGNKRPDTFDDSLGFRLALGAAE